MTEVFKKLAGTTEQAFALENTAGTGLRRVNEEVQLEDPGRAYPLRQIVPTQTLRLRVIPDVNGDMYLLGGYIQTDTGEALASGTPITASLPYFNARMAIAVTAASGAPFTIRVTGTSVNQDTGATTTSDTEDIAISGNGTYITTKHWLNAPQVSILEAAKSCTVALYRALAYQMNGKRLQIRSVTTTWMPDNPVWDITITVYKVAANGLVSTLHTFTKDSTDTPPWADEGEPGRFREGAIDTWVDGSQGEGIVVTCDQNRLGWLLLEIEYDG